MRFKFFNSLKVTLFNLTGRVLAPVLAPDVSRYLDPLLSSTPAVGSKRSCSAPNVTPMRLPKRKTLTFTVTLLAEPFLTVHMLCTEKILCPHPVKFLLSMFSALLSNSFEPRPNRCSFLTVSFRRTFRRHFYLLPAGSVSIIGFSQNLMLALEKPV